MNVSSRLLTIANMVSAKLSKLLFALFAFSLLHYFRNFTMYIVQYGAATHGLKIMQMWKNTEYRYRYRGILKYQ